MGEFSSAADIKESWNFRQSLVFFSINTRFPLNGWGGNYNVIHLPFYFSHSEELRLLCGLPPSTEVSCLITEGTCWKMFCWSAAAAVRIQYTSGQDSSIRHVWFFLFVSFIQPTNNHEWLGLSWEAYGFLVCIIKNIANFPLSSPSIWKAFFVMPWFFNYVVLLSWLQYNV